jgi:hypothetical protein
VTVIEVVPARPGLLTTMPTPRTTLIGPSTVIDNGTGYVSPA